MENYIIELKNGEKHLLNTEYKRISVTNKMALYYYIEVFSQVSRKDIIEIRKPISQDEIDKCSLIITVTKKMVKRFNQA
nr:MAG TPA: hypothetical protein [Bacteriophage sp.]